MSTDALPTLSRTVTQDMVTAYGRINGDNNRLHYDADAARAAGFARPIVHGALTAAVLSQACQAYFGPSWRTTGYLRVRFRRPLLVDDTVTSGGRVVSERQLDGATRVTLDVWCTDGAGETVLRGEAEGVRPDGA